MAESSARGTELPGQSFSLLPVDKGLEDRRAICARSVGRTVLKNRFAEKLGGRHATPMTRLREHWQCPRLCLDNQELMSFCICHNAVWGRVTLQIF